MDITTRQIAVLNARLPAGFVLEPVYSEEPVKRPVESVQQMSARAQRALARPEFDAVPTRLRTSEGFLRAYSLLQRLKSHPDISYFLHPLRASEYPDYYEVIAEPLSLEEIEERLLAGEFQAMKQLAEAVRKMWNNSFLYNTRGSELYIRTVDLSAFFETLIRDCEHLSIGNLRSDLGRSREERRALSRRIERLSASAQSGLQAIIQTEEWDLDALPAETLERVAQYVSQCEDA